MLIRHKGIEHGVYTDAPFIGARISAVYCSNECPGCFNTHLLIIPETLSTSEDIIREVSQNDLNQGIILAGLEWTEQPEEMNILIEEALDAGLKVMVYTHLDVMSFVVQFNSLAGKDVFVKGGEYVSTLDGYYDAINDVRLASRNQRIINLKDFGGGPREG